MDHRTAPGPDRANRDQTPTALSQGEGSSPNGRVRENDEHPADQRSWSVKPALTEREREERWPLG